MKKKVKCSKPTLAGRVVSTGLSTKWPEYYMAGRKERKTNLDSLEVKELKAKVAQIPDIVKEQVQNQLGETINALMPTLVVGLREWVKGGQQGAPRIPSFTGSNSHSATPLMSPAAAALVSSTAAPILELNAPRCGEITPAGTSPASGPSVNFPTAVGGASTLATLDAIMVTKPRQIYDFISLAFDCASLTPYMFSQGDANVPCTLLHFVDGELIDVAKAKIVEPANRVYHGNPMPHIVYRVQLVRVLPGCDDVLPPF